MSIDCYCYDSLSLCDENFEFNISSVMTLEEFIGINGSIFFKENTVYDKFYRLIDLFKMNGNYYVKGIENFHYGVKFTKKIKIKNPNFYESRSGLYIIDKHRFGYEIIDKDTSIYPDRPYIMIKHSENPFKENQECGIYMKYLKFEEKSMPYNHNLLNNIKGLRGIVLKKRKQLNENQEREYNNLIKRIPEMPLFREWCCNRLIF